MPPVLSFIGCGHLGRTLGRLWSDAGVFRIGDVLTRSPGSAAAAVAFMGSGRAVADAGELQAADVFVIATADDRIAEACGILAARRLVRPGTVVFHCSGAQSSAVLSGATAAGAAVASAHPIRSFADPDAVVRKFAGTWCGMEGDAAALALLEPAFAAIGGRTVRIEASAKTLYHAAAVFAGNYTTTLLAIARDAYAATGIAPDDALRLLEPLVRENIDNVFRIGPAAALAGPVARGDMATVARQQQAVSDWNAECGELYRQLVAHTQALAAQRNKST